MILARRLCLPGTLWDRRTKTLWDKVYFGALVRTIGNLKLRRARCDHTCQAGSLLSANTRSWDSTTRFAHQIWPSSAIYKPSFDLFDLFFFFVRPITLSSCPLQYRRPHSFFTTHYPCLGNFPTASLFFDSLDDVVDTRSSAILRPRSHLRRCFSANASLCHQARLWPVANGSSSCFCWARFGMGHFSSNGLNIENFQNHPNDIQIQHTDPVPMADEESLFDVFCDSVSPSIVCPNTLSYAIDRRQILGNWKAVTSLIRKLFSLRRDRLVHVALAWTKWRSVCHKTWCSCWFNTWTSARIHNSSHRHSQTVTRHIEELYIACWPESQHPTVEKKLAKRPYFRLWPFSRSIAANIPSFFLSCPRS